MYIVTQDPNNFEIDWQKELRHYKKLNDAKREATKLSVLSGKACIYRLETIIIPIDEIPVQAYKVKENGEILPCD